MGRGVRSIDDGDNLELSHRLRERTTHGPGDELWARGRRYHNADKRCRVHRRDARARGRRPSEAKATNRRIEEDEPFTWPGGARLGRPACHADAPRSGAASAEPP